MDQRTEASCLTTVRSHVNIAVEPIIDRINAGFPSIIVNQGSQQSSQTSTMTTVKTGQQSRGSHQQINRGLIQVNSGLDGINRHSMIPGYGPIAFKVSSKFKELRRLLKLLLVPHNLQHQLLLEVHKQQARQLKERVFNRFRSRVEFNMDLHRPMINPRPSLSMQFEGSWCIHLTAILNGGQQKNLY